MAKINRKFIDKHWLMFMVRGAIALAFGGLILFNGASAVSEIIAVMSVFLLFMGIVDAVGALYSSTKKHDWFNSVVDALIDVVAALLLLFFAKDSLINSLLVVSIYTILSGIVDVLHGILSAEDATDRFIRMITGVIGCVIGLVILNAGSFEVTMFVRFFGAYMLIVGTTSMIYGVHNRSQGIEDKIARSEARKKSVKKSKK